METKLDVDFDETSLGEALSRLATEFGLVMVVDAGRIRMLPPNHADSRQSLTYKVRGLLVDGVTLEQLNTLCAAELAQPSAVESVGASTLVIKALETEHQKVSALLGSLAPSR